jgi:uncharacterized delta-60 repeat protein
MNLLQLRVFTFLTTHNFSTASPLLPFARHYACSLLLFFLLATSAGTASAQGVGTADPTWSIAPLPDQTIFAIAVQPGGKVVAAGKVLGSRDISLFRFDFTGNLDTSFGIGGKVDTFVGNQSASVSNIAVDSSGRIYVAGTYRDGPVQGVPVPNFSGLAVTRFNADGSLDYSFGSYGLSKVRLTGTTIFDEAGIPTAPRDIAFQADGKLLLMTVGHEATAPAGVQSIALIRFDTNGQLDLSFADNGLSLIRIPGNNGSPHVMRVGKDGSIFVAGGEDDNSRGFVIKLSSQGKIDPAFGTAGRVSGGSGIDKFYAMGLGIQDDNKVVVAGRRWRTNESPEGDGILALRLNANGSLDTGFGEAGYSFHNPSPIFDFAITLALEPGGNILLAGSSTTHDGTPNANPLLIRLNPNGRLDTSFGGSGIVSTAGLTSSDLKVFDGAYLLTRNLQLATSTDHNLFSVRKIITQSPTAAPQASITGGNKTIADTDGVAGEIVTVTGSATDSDGTVVYTDWVLNGVPAATGQSALLTVRDGANTITYTALDSSSAKAAATVTYNVVAPSVPLPRIGAYSSLGENTFDTEFSIAIRNAAGALVTTAPITQPLTIAGFIFPREGYANFGADIFVVVATPNGWFMRNAAGGFEPWNRDIATLVPAYKNQVLSDPARVPVYAGQLPLPGSYQLFIGLKIQGSSEIIYSANAGSVTITAP